MAEPMLALPIVETIIGVIGLTGNAIVVIVICKVKFMHTKTNAFICNQAVVDFLGSLFLIVTSALPVPDPLPDNSGYQIVCLFWLSEFFLWACYTSSTYNLVFLTCERYVAIVYPFKYVTLYTRKSIVGMVAIVWLLGLILEGAYSVMTNRFENGQCFRSTSVSAQVLSIVIIVVHFLIPAIFMLFSYSHMAVELKRSANRVGAVAPTVSAYSAPGNGEGEERPENAEQSLLRARRNVFRTLLLVFITFLVCWTPMQIIFFVTSVGLRLYHTTAIYITSLSLVGISSCTNPFIYAFKYKQFQRGFLFLIGRPIQAEDTPGN
ncbi:allatostatin-A receptor-like [Acanthaster planci]|uniref:Allatostatin-A receptor-like n=1 Tax=Acanthaster planci TaxID=133434 RepID=A0A8B7XJH0_ACAPL|nr:allatostatin-A receptor-like [Acanthaster planci]